MGCSPSRRPLLATDYISAQNISGHANSNLILGTTHTGGEASNPGTYGN